MADFSVLKLTNAGIDLQVKVQAGATLSFSRLGFGSGTLIYPDDIPAMTALVNQEMSHPISEVKKISNTQYKVTGIITPADLPVTGFDFTELGLFAADPDDGEILFAVAYAGANSDYIPAIGGGSAYDYAINQVMTVGSADNVTVVVDTAAAASKQDIVDHELKQLDPNNTDAAKDKHLSNAQAHLWQLHINNEELHASFASGTPMLFLQATAPVGWTKKSNWGDNYSIIVGNTYGTGGSDSPVSWQTEIGIDDHGEHDHALVAHYHTYSGIPNHRHTANSQTTPGTYGHEAASQILYSAGYTGYAGQSSCSTDNGGGGSTGSNGPVTHTVHQNTYTPKYVIAISATKD